MENQTIDTLAPAATQSPILAELQSLHQRTVEQQQTINELKAALAKAQASHAALKVEVMNPLVDGLWAVFGPRIRDEIGAALNDQMDATEDRIREIVREEIEDSEDIVSMSYLEERLESDISELMERQVEDMVTEKIDSYMHDNLADAVHDVVSNINFEVSVS